MLFLWGPCDPNTQLEAFTLRLGKHNSGYDLWLGLLTLQAWNKHVLVDMVARSSTPVSPTGGRNSCRHSGFQVLCSCRGYVIFHNQPKGSRVLASSLSSDLLNVSERFTKGWHREARGSGCCVWVNVDDLVIQVCGHQNLMVEAYGTAGLLCFCIPWSSSVSPWQGLHIFTLNLFPL